MAFQIIKHAFAMVFGNFGQALRLSIGPYILSAALLYAVASFLDIGSASFVFLAMNPAAVDPVITLYALFALIVAMTVTGWVAVAWHRFILLEEYVEIVPPMNGPRIISYLIKTGQMGILITLVGMVIALVGGLILGLTQLLLLPYVEQLFNLALALMISYFWLRMGLALPSAAVAADIGIAESIQKTKRLSLIIWQVVFLMGLLNLIAQGIQPLFATSPLAIQLAVSAAIYWVSLMVGLSVLTTFYGHIVENRPLAE